MRPGERQASPKMEGIAPDHKMRYAFAASAIESWMNGIGMTEPPSVLDVGCGVGYGSQIVAMGMDCSILAVDVDPEAIEFAREHYPHPQIKHSVADVTSEWYPPFVARTDAAICFEALEHVEDPEAILMSLARDARFLIASVPNEDVVPWTIETHPYHVRHYTPQEFNALLEGCGWDVDAFGCQRDKWSGEIFKGTDGGRTIIAVAFSKTKD